MKANTFQDDSTEGFLLERVRENLIHGRFVEKISFQEIITDPFGGSRTFDRIVYNQLEFTLSPTFPNIEFQDAPRSTQNFISKVTEYANFSVSVNPLAVDLLRWTENFQTALKTKAVIVSLQISGLEIEQGISARMVLTGEKDVRAALRMVTNNKNYELNTVQLRVAKHDSVSFLQLSRGGSAKIDEADFEEFIPALRRSLPQPKSTHT